MAIELEIPKDVRKYEKKTVGPLSTRQVISVIPAALFGGLVFKLTQGMQQDLQLFLISIVTVPFLAFGFIKVYGLPLEVFLKNALISFMSPKRRLYQTTNMFESASAKYELTQEEKNNKHKAIIKHRKKKKCKLERFS